MELSWSHVPGILGLLNMKACFANLCRCLHDVFISPERVNYIVWFTIKDSGSKYVGSRTAFAVMWPWTNLFLSLFINYIGLRVPTCIWFPHLWVSNEPLNVIELCDLLHNWQLLFHIQKMWKKNQQCSPSPFLSSSLPPCLPFSFFGLQNFYYRIWVYHRRKQ